MVVENSVDELDTLNCETNHETEVDRAVEALADDEHPPDAAATVDDDKMEGGRHRKKKNFNLKKQLSKADTKLRDLFAPVSRRGSGASGGTGGGGGGSGKSDSEELSRLSRDGGISKAEGGRGGGGGGVFDGGPELTMTDEM